MEPDHVYTSYLKRAVKTAWLALGAMGREYAPETRAWQLNERMYGLAGLTPQEAYAKCVGLGCWLLTNTSERVMGVVWCVDVLGGDTFVTQSHAIPTGTARPESARGPRA